MNENEINEIMENGTEVVEATTETVVETVSNSKLNKNLKTAAGVGITACVCIVAYDHVVKPAWKWCRKKFGDKETTANVDEAGATDVPKYCSDSAGEKSEE